MPDHRLVALLGVIALHALALWAGLTASPTRTHPIDIDSSLVTVALLPSSAASQPTPAVPRPVTRPAASPKREMPAKPTPPRNTLPNPSPAPTPTPLPAPAPLISEQPAETAPPDSANSVADPAPLPKSSLATKSEAAADAAPDTPPEFSAAYLNNPAPPYPARAQRMRQQGTVQLRVHVNADGSPIEVQLFASSGVPSLDEAAMSAVRRWRFVPAKRGNAPVSAWVKVPVAFKLD